MVYSLVKTRVFRKTGTFTATNAMLNLNVMSQMSGTSKKDASVAADASYFQKVPGLAIVKIAANATAELPGYILDSEDVNYLYNNGTMGDTVPPNQYTLNEEGHFVAPAVKPEEDIDRVIIRYDRTADAGIAVKNSADKFPQTIRLILKVLIVDPCNASLLRAAIIDIPSFQPSPELSMTFSSDSTIEFSGDLQVNYCSSDQELYSIYVLESDEEEED